MRIRATAGAVAMATVLMIPVCGGRAAAAPAPVEYSSGGAFSTCEDSSCNAYFSADTADSPPGYREGFSWYSQAWPLLAEPIDGLQIGLSSTWISPNNVNQPTSVQRAFCAKSKFDDMRDGSWWGYFQTIEGSLGWWASTKFRTVMPKYAMNGTPDCYNTMYSSPGWTFDDTRPVRRSETALVQFSNRLLVPPDGMPLTPASSGGYLGTAWMSLPLPSPGRAIGAGPSGNRAWTLFINADNFNGPVTYWLPKAWSTVTDGTRTLKGLGLDTSEGFVDGFASEWNSVPFMTQTDAKGTVFTKVPPTAFPIDSKVRTIFTRDAQAHSAGAIADRLSAWMAGKGLTPMDFDESGASPELFTTGGQTFYQEGDRLPDLLSTVKLQSFDGGSAYGLQWADQQVIGHLPGTFKKVGRTRVAVPESAVPSALAAATFEYSPDPAFTYSSPSWWSASKASSRDYTTRLLDGSTVTYHWYRFVDQPAFQRLNLTQSQATVMQRNIVRMQRAWASGTSFMAPPKEGALVSLDPGLLVTPPAGLEYGFVPYVIAQTNTK